LGVSPDGDTIQRKETLVAEAKQTTIDDVHHDPYVLTKEKIQNSPTGLKNSLKFLGQE